MKGLTLSSLFMAVAFFCVVAKEMTKEEVYKAASEVYIVPEGYTGRVRIVYGVEGGGKPQYKGATPVYQVPNDGFILTRAAPPSSSGPAAFFYEDESGKRDHIRNQLISIKPKNIGEDPETIYVLEGGLGYTRAPSRLDCDIYNKRHWIGTRESIWSGIDNDDIIPYLMDHGIGCDAISTEGQAR